VASGLTQAVSSGGIPNNAGYYCASDIGVPNGYGAYNSGNVASKGPIVTNAPEPACVALLGVGLFALGLINVNRAFSQF
jgi:hypothetical protein